MTEVRWQRVNDEPFEYAIQQGGHGDEFVKLLDGTCLRRRPDATEREIGRLRDALWQIANDDDVCSAGNALASRALGQ